MLMNGWKLVSLVGQSVFSSAESAVFHLPLMDITTRDAIGLMRANIGGREFTNRCMTNIVI